MKMPKFTGKDEEVQFPKAKGTRLVGKKLKVKKMKRK